MSTTPFLAEFMTAPPTLTDGMTSPIRCDAYGTLVAAVPGQVAALDMDFVGNNGWLAGTPTAINTIISCTRASTGSYVTKNGILQPAVFANNILRMGDNGLLIEEQRANIVLQSNTFSNAAWGKNQSSVTATSMAGPDNVAGSAVHLTEDSTAASTHTFSQNRVVTNATVYTTSINLKAAERTWAFLTDGAGVTATAYFNLATGTLGSISGSGSPSAAIFPLTSGWYKCCLTYTALGTTANLQFASTTNNGVFTYNGDGASGIYCYGGQFEAGAFPTSYIPTTTAAVTRNADVVPFLTTSWLDTTKGTFYANAIQLPSGSPIFAARIVASQGSRSYLDVNNNTSVETYTGTVSTTANAGSGTWQSLSKAAAGYDATGQALCMNNGTIGTSATVQNFGGTTYWVGGDAGTSPYFGGYINRISYWSSKLSNSTLQALTTP